MAKEARQQTPDQEAENSCLQSFTGNGGKQTGNLVRLRTLKADL